MAAFVGLKGIQYVSRVATFAPLIPIAILLILFVKTAGGIRDFDAEAFIAAGTDPEAIGTQGLSSSGVIALTRVLS